MATSGQPALILTRWGMALACVIPFLAVSTQSFWIDEALTALKAAQPNLAGWWHQMVAEKMSDLQMPLYMSYAWGWARLFGTGEWALRAANLPWFIGGLLAFAFSFRGADRMLAASVGGLSSFAWFYLDEARPYAMQIGVSLGLVASLRFLHGGGGIRQTRACWAWAFCAGVAILAGTSLLGFLWSGAALAVAVAGVGWARLVEVGKAARFAWLTLVVWLVGLAVYYVWTMRLGARASAMGTTNLQNAGFVGYELLGFGGLGPGRLEIRESGLAAFRAHWLPLAAYGGLAGVLLGAGLVSLWRQDRRRLLWVGLVILATGACLLGAGWAMHFRVLGRHCAPAQAGVLVLLVTGAATLTRRRDWWLRFAVCGFLLASAGACLSARFAARHLKDDYRAAAAHARAALEAGQDVWWSADLHGAAFYGLPVSESPTEPGRAIALLNRSVDAVGALRLPDMVVCSKPDLYDAQGAVARRLAEAGWQPATNFPAFTVWQPKGANRSAPAAGSQPGQIPVL